MAHRNPSSNPGALSASSELLLTSSNLDQTPVEVRPTEARCLSMCLNTMLGADENSRPLKSFELFPKLPIELRLRIWQWSTRQGRVIELYVPSRDRPFISSFGGKALICSPSHQPPSMLHANRESRAEALRIYTLRMFGRDLKQVYFNNKVDILLFRSDLNATRRRAVPSLLVSEISRNNISADLPVERVAIPLEGLAGNSWALGNVMEALYGNAQTPAGYPGLKEIIFVVPTLLWDNNPGVINERWTLMPTTCDGLTSAQSLVTARIRKLIDCIRSGQPSISEHNISLPNWIDGAAAQPTFSFSSVRPIGWKDNKVRDGIAVFSSLSGC